MGGPLDTAVARPVGAAAPAPGVESASGGGLLARGFKLLLAILLIPACIGFSLGFHECVFGLKERLGIALFGWPTAMKWFAGGAAAFAALAVLFWRPVIVYVFAHELVHALATWLCLGQVTNLQASAAGGKVTTSKSNTFIRLAPYFVPLYAMLAALLFVALDAGWRPMAEYRWALSAALGFTMAFHVGFTLWSLNRGQPDLKPDGWLFSLVIIYLANVLVLAAMLGIALTGSLGGAWEALQGVCQDGWARSVDLYRDLAAALQGHLSRK